MLKSWVEIRHTGANPLAVTDSNHMYGSLSHTVSTLQRTMIYVKSMVDSLKELSVLHEQQRVAGEQYRRYVEERKLGLVEDEID